MSERGTFFGLAPKSYLLTEYDAEGKVKVKKGAKGLNFWFHIEIFKSVKIKLKIENYRYSESCRINWGSFSKYAVWRNDVRRPCKFVYCQCEPRNDKNIYVQKRVEWFLYKSSGSSWQSYCHPSHERRKININLSLIDFF